MAKSCAQCSKQLEEHLSFETPRGETVCAPCYFAVWGFSGAAEISLEADRLMEGRRQAHSKPIRWTS
jgi:hypothetical protein